MRRYDPGRTVLIVALVVAGLFVGAGVLASAVYVLTYNRVEKQQKAAVEQLPTRDEFQAKWVGRTRDEVLAAFGKPESTDEYQGRQTWHYGEVAGDQAYARDPIADKPIRFVRLEFDRDGKVVKVGF